MNRISTLSQLRRTRSRFAVVIVGLMIFLGMPKVQAVGLSPAILDMRLNPGEVVERTVTVVNTEDVARTFQFAKENFSPSDEPGIPVFDGGARDDFPSWMSVEPSMVSLAPRGEASVTVTVAVPVDAPRRDFYGVVFAAPEPSPQTSARTALLLFLTVLGEANYDLDLVSFELESVFASTLGNAATIRAQNAGNVYVKPGGEIVLDPLIGRRISTLANPQGLRLLAGESREWSVALGSGFALGPVWATVGLAAEDGEAEESRTSVFWVIPWRQFGIPLFVVLLFAVFFRRMRSRS